MAEMQTQTFADAVGDPLPELPAHMRDDLAVRAALAHLSGQGLQALRDAGDGRRSVVRSARCCKTAGTAA